MTSDQRARQQQQQLLFYALSDPTRRSIVELLSRRGQMAATQIYENFSMTHPAVSQHLKVLRDADVVTLERSAQRHIYGLNTASIRELEVWASRLAELWDGRFERMDELLDAEKDSWNRGIPGGEESR